MEVLRFGSRRGGKNIGCCAIEVIQGFNVNPDSPAPQNPMTHGDSGTVLMQDGGPRSAGQTYRDQFINYLRVGTHDLSAIYINGAGALDVDRVKGLSFEVSIQGSGIARIDEVDVDQMKVGVSGAGTTRLAGRAAKLTATVRGTSTFEGDGLRVTDAVIGAEGPSVVRAQVTNSAKVDASGLVSVALTGNPACTVKARGSANVTGCKAARY